MSRDPNEDLAYEMGDPCMCRYLQEDEEEEVERSEMLRKRMYLDPPEPRRTPVTEEWLVRNRKEKFSEDDLSVHSLMDRERYDIRKASLRDTKWNQRKAFCGVLLMWTVASIMAVGVCILLLSGLIYAAQRLREVL